MIFSRDSHVVVGVGGGGISTRHARKERKKNVIVWEKTGIGFLMKEKNEGCCGSYIVADLINNPSFCVFFRVSVYEHEPWN